MVEKEDVNEAMRLMEMSKESLNPAVEHTRSVSYLLTLMSTHSQLLFCGHILLSLFPKLELI